ncbi:MAG: prolipoprotein diacylglyceryl transferase [Verrucomicrobiota bacterium]
MDKVAFYLFGRPIHWYGIAVASGFFLAILNWAHFTKKEGYGKQHGSDLGFWIMISSILGARLAYVLSSWPEYVKDPMSIIRIDQGGLIFYGGFIGGGVAVVVYALVKKIPMWVLGDVAVVGLVLGHGVGRIGCFMNGCCYGSECALPWAVHFPEEPAGVTRHPTQLYEACFNFLVYGFLVWYYPRKKKHGAVVAMYLSLYPVGRFLLEIVRGDRGERLSMFGLSSAQNLSIFLFSLGMVLWFVLPNRLDRPKAEESRTPA